MSGGTLGEATVWHDVECGSYAADLQQTITHAVAIACCWGLVSLT